MVPLFTDRAFLRFVHGCAAVIALIYTDNVYLPAQAKLSVQLTFVAAPLG